MPHHLALGTYVVFEGESDYARRCFSEYAMLPDKSGRYAALYRPIHMIGLELGVSVASVGAAQGADRRAHRLPLRRGRDRQARAQERRGARRRRRLLRLGQAGSGRALARRGLLPLGLAHEVALKRDVAEGECLRWSDVAYDENDPAVKVRREMEAAFGRPNLSPAHPETQALDTKAPLEGLALDLWAFCPLR